MKVNNPTPVEVEAVTFDRMNAEAKLVVPDGSKAQYEVAEGWDKFKYIVEASDIKPVTVHVATAGSLSTLIAEADKYSIEQLKVTGELNGNDLNYLREMEGNETPGVLHILDLSEAKLVYLAVRLMWILLSGS